MRHVIFCEILAMTVPATIYPFSYWFRFRPRAIQGRSMLTLGVVLMLLVDLAALYTLFPTAPARMAAAVVIYAALTLALSVLCVVVWRTPRQ